MNVGDSNIVLSFPSWVNSCVGDLRVFPRPVDVGVICEAELEVLEL